MCRRNRSSLINPDEINIVHAVAKTVRNLFLFGQDYSADSDYSHRKDWIFSIMEFQSTLMAVDVLDFAIMSNHIHFVLRTRPDIVNTLDDHEVARRWLTLCPKSKKRTLVDGKVIVTPIPPKAADIAVTAADKDKIKKLRLQLSSVSWWMRLLCQKVAQRANFEDGISMGHFFKGRFHATLINDEPHLLGCSVYVDLNAIKAAMTETLDGYNYISASVRLEQIRLRHRVKKEAERQEDHPDIPQKTAIHSSKGEFLSPIKIEKLGHLPELHLDGFRCSDKGFLDMTEQEYIDLLQWCITNKILDERTADPETLPDCLTKRGIAPDIWVAQVRDFDGLYRYEAGVKPQVDVDVSIASNATGTSPGDQTDTDPKNA